MFSSKKSKKDKELNSTLRTEYSSDRSLLTNNSEETKRVNFRQRRSIYSTLSRDSYASEEMRATWLQAEEFEKIQDSCVRQIRRMEKGKDFDDKKYCNRGLESHTRTGLISKSNTRRPSIHAVLELQERLKEKDEGDVTVTVGEAEEISRRYQQMTSSSQLWATRVGLRDQLEAEEDSSVFLTTKY